MLASFPTSWNVWDISFYISLN